MNPSMLLRASSTLALAPALAALSHGAITSFADASAFAAALQPGSYTEAFTGSAGTAPSYGFSGGTPAFGYAVTVPPSTNPTFGDPNVAVYRSGTFIGSNFPNERLAFTPTTGNVSAFGGEFFLTDVVNAFQAQSVTVTATDSLGASLSQTFTPTGAGAGSFRGFATTGVLTSVVLSAPASGLFYGSADNVTVGRASPVPEPSALLVLGLPALGLLRRRRRA